MGLGEAGQALTAKLAANAGLVEAAEGGALVDRRRVVVVEERDPRAQLASALVAARQPYSGTERTPTACRDKPGRALLGYRAGWGAAGAAGAEVGRMDREPPPVVTVSESRAAGLVATPTTSKPPWLSAVIA